MLRNWKVLLVVFISVVGSVFLGTASASASGAHCGKYTVNAGEAYNPPVTKGPVRFVPRNSTCRDINVVITNTQAECRSFRVIFYPTTKPSYSGAWHEICGTSLQVVATSVLDGTKYQLDTQPGAHTSVTVFD